MCKKRSSTAIKMPHAISQSSFFLFSFLNCIQRTGFCSWQIVITIYDKHQHWAHVKEIQFWFDALNQFAKSFVIRSIGLCKQARSFKTSIPSNKHVNSFFMRFANCKSSNRWTNDMQQFSHTHTACVHAKETNSITNFMRAAKKNSFESGHDSWALALINLPFVFCFWSNGWAGLVVNKFWVLRVHLNVTHKNIYNEGVCATAAIDHRLNTNGMRRHHASCATTKRICLFSPLDKHSL